MSFSSLLYRQPGHNGRLRTHRSRNVKLIICFALRHCYSSFIHRVNLVESPQLAAFTITLTQVQILTVSLSPSFHASPRKDVNDRSILKREGRRQFLTKSAKEDIFKISSEH